MNQQKRGHNLLESILGTLKSDLFSDQTSSGLRAQSTNYLFTGLAQEISIYVLNKHSRLSGEFGTGSEYTWAAEEVVSDYLISVHFFKKDHTQQPSASILLGC